MRDIVISGGTILDGFTGDVAILAVGIVAAGGQPGPACRVIEAVRHAEDPGSRPGRLVLAKR